MMSSKIMKMFDRVKYLLFIFLFLLSCKKSNSNLENTHQKSDISIAAAANLRDVLEELKQVYIKEYPDKKVNLTFGSSGQLAQQITNGAPFDLFLSANTSFPEKLKEQNKTVGDSKVYAYGRIALWSLNMDVSEGLKVVLNPEVKKIVIANPELAPYGKNTVEALKKAGLYSKIESKIVWSENISQAAQFTSTGSADLGFIALSNAKNKQMEGKGYRYELTEEECKPIAQSGILIKGSQQKEAKLFFDFITSDKMIPLWEHYGYLVK